MTPSVRPVQGSGQAGFSLTEVLIATVILAAALVPALDALSSATLGVSVQQSESELHFRLREKLEDVLAVEFGTLDDEAQALASHTAVSAVYSDPVSSRNRRRVYLSRYDGDNADGDGDSFTGVDQNLLWVRVDIEGTRHALETLVSAYE